MEKQTFQPVQVALKVAQVVRPATGGIRRHVSLLCMALDSNLFVPILFAPEDFELENLPGHPNTSISMERHSIEIGATTRPLRDLQAVRSLTHLLRTLHRKGTCIENREKSGSQIGLLHAHGIRAALIGIPAARRLSIPAIFTAHNLLPKMNMVQKLIFTMISRHACRVVAVSQAVAESLIANGVPSDKIVVIPNGIDLKPFNDFQQNEARKAELPETDATNRFPYQSLSPNISKIEGQLGAPREDLRIVAIGRLSHEKGFDILIEAFSRVVAQLPHALLLIAGEGPARKALELQISRSEVAQRIVLLGRTDEIVPLLASASLVVVPSRQEGQGIVALEAMAAGRPVVATAIGGLVETIVPDVTGSLVAPEAPTALAESLISLLNDPARCAEMGRAGRERVERLYTLERMMNKIQSLYTEIHEQVQNK